MVWFFSVNSIFFDRAGVEGNNTLIEFELAHLLVRQVFKSHRSIFGGIAHLLHPPLVVWARQSVRAFFLCTGCAVCRGRRTRRSGSQRPTNRLPTSCTAAGAFLPTGCRQIFAPAISAFPPSVAVVHRGRMDSVPLSSGMRMSDVRSQCSRLISFKHPESWGLFFMYRIYGSIFAPAKLTLPPSMAVVCRGRRTRTTAWMQKVEQRKEQLPRMLKRNFME